MEYITIECSLVCKLCSRKGYFFCLQVPYIYINEKIILLTTTFLNNNENNMWLILWLFPEPQSAAAQKTPESLKYISLVLLTLQNALLILVMRYVRTREGDMFIATTAVIMSEVFKFGACLIIILIQVSYWSYFCIAYLLASFLLEMMKD